MADIAMPQLGETVTEGTITRWFKQVGDPVALDEVLYEVSTDKVDTEVPSPCRGTSDEIRVPEGDTVDVGTVLAVIGDGAGAPAPAPAAAPRPRSRAGPGPQPAPQPEAAPLLAGPGPGCRPPAPPPPLRRSGRGAPAATATVPTRSTRAATGPARSTSGGARRARSCRRSSGG